MYDYIIMPKLLLLLFTFIQVSGIPRVKNSSTSFLLWTARAVFFETSIVFLFAPIAITNPSPGNCDPTCVSYKRSPLQHTHALSHSRLFK